MDPTPYTKEEIEKLLREEEFPYHRVELPYGLRTPGQDRSATRDLIFPASLEGKSVLDVGCALGYFCFEAEKRGAAPVIGAEPKEIRFQKALLLKRILGSRVEFIQRDIVREPLDRHFDYVCLLNVIHHVKEPVRAMRQLATITKERLIIEFPTFADVRFASNVGITSAEPFNRLPLVGVSSMHPSVDQTFVFSPAAIERILTDHDPLFREVTIIPSPMPGRQIALCFK